MPPLKVLQCSTQDSGGGAETLAFDLHQAYRNHDLDAWMVVGQKNRTSEHVVPLSHSPHYDYSKKGAAIGKAHRSLKTRILTHIGYRLKSNLWSHSLLQLTGNRRPDVLQCHNLHGGYFDIDILPVLSQALPVIVHLHDMWLFTGHCAYSFDCERWQTGCGKCPYLQSPPAMTRDWTHRHWKNKRSLFQRSRLNIACSSEWIARKARRSILNPAIQDLKVIPNPIDLSVFHPADNTCSVRRALDLPESEPIILFVANLGAENPYKDGETMLQAIDEMRQSGQYRKLTFVILGAKENARHSNGSFSIRHIKHTPDRCMVARYFQAADLTWHMAKQEVFGMVIAESLACGTPVIASDVGGISEVFKNGSEGILIDRSDVRELIRATEELLGDPQRQQQFSAAARSGAESRFDSKVILPLYISWLHDLIDEQDTHTKLASVG